MKGKMMMQNRTRQLAVLFTLTTLLTLGCGRRPPPEDDTHNDDAIPESRLTSLYADLKTGRVSDKLSLRQGSGLCVSPIRATPTRLADSTTTHALIQHVFPLYERKESVCIRMTEFLIALGQMRVPDHDPAYNLGDREAALTVIGTVYGVAEPELRHDFEIVDWDMVFYHTLRNSLARYLETCHTNFPVSYFKSDDKGTRKAVINFDCRNLEEDERCVDHVRFGLDETLGVGIYPAVFAEAADRLFVLGQIRDPSERAKLEREVMDDIVGRELEALGFLESEDASEFDMQAAGLDYADRLMPFTFGSWSDHLYFIFMNGLCGDAVPLKRQQQSLTLWRNRIKDDPNQNRWRDHEIPETVTAFCDMYIGGRRETAPNGPPED